MFTFAIVKKCFELFANLLVDIQHSQSKLAIDIIEAVKGILG